WNAAPWLWFFEHVGGGRCPVINFSGGTEAGACFLSALPVTPLKTCALVGPSLGMDIDLFGPDGRPLAGGAGGVVCEKQLTGRAGGDGGGGERRGRVGRDLGVALAGRLGPRRLGLARRRRRLVPPRPERRHAERRRQADRPGGGRVGRGEPPVGGRGGGDRRA